MKTLVFLGLILAASLAVSATLIGAFSDSATLRPSSPSDSYPSFEYTWVLDDTEIHWFGCSWAEFRCD